MKRTILLWVVAVVITLASAIYQRMTGPTYPLSGEVSVSGETISYRLLRSHGGETDAPVEIKTNNEAINGTLFWKRFKTDDEFIAVTMKYSDGKLIAYLPNQPKAGKLEYYVELNNVKIPVEENVVIRFKGNVPVWFNASFNKNRFGDF
jgi:hypothetical protein